jgi:MFS family permease
MHLFGGICKNPLYLQQQRGLSLAQAAIIDTTFFAAAALGELPTGIVADSFGRKTSLVAGAVLLAVGMLAWVFAPTMPLIMLAYVILALGNNFLTGADDAFFYESLQRTGRADDYPRLAGRANATMLGALALGNVASGLLATIDLLVPFLIASLSFLILLGLVLTFKEPQIETQSGGRARKPYREVVRQSLALMRDRPTLRYPMLYLALVPVASLIMETVFLQPQAVALGVPIAGVGVVVMAVQLTNMAGASWSHRIQARFGEGRVLYAAPALIVASLIVLAALQVLPALLFIAVISFLTAVVQPLLMRRIQHEVADEIRATMLSMQSLMFTFLLAISQPTLGVIADHAGLPAAYFGLAGGLSMLVLFLFWKSRRHFPQVAPRRAEGNVTTILASDRAGAMAPVIADITCGALVEM